MAPMVFSDYKARLLGVLTAAWMLAGCNRSQEKAAETISGPVVMFSLVSPDSCGIRFNNVLVESDSINPVSYPYVYNGSGVAAGDINGDGLQDLYFSSNQETGRLYLNKGNFEFEDITEKSGTVTKGWCTGVTMADVNADGHNDIYICRAGKFTSPEQRSNLLFINNGNLTFTERSAEYGLDDKGFSGQSTFFDYDRDGDLDVFVLNQPVDINFKLEEMRLHNSRITPYHTSRLFENKGAGRFEDVSRAAGVQSNAFSLSVTVSDLNGDHWPDMYVCNDYMMSDFVLINTGKKSFTDENRKYLQHTSYFSMGCDIADFNNDGLPDILQGDMLPETSYRQKLLLGPNNYDRYFFMLEKGYGQQFMQNCLQLNNGNGTFSEIAAFAGVEKTDWSWACFFADFDNDGWKDIFFDNGYLRDFTNLDHVMYRSEIVRRNKGSLPDPMEVVRQIPATPTRNYVFRNNTDLTFTDKTAEWGLHEKAFSNGAAYADLDNDGDQDLIVNNMNGVANMYRNNAEQKPGNNFITFRFNGSKLNPAAIGTSVKIFAGGMVQTGYVMPVRGFNSAVDARVHFGLGNASQVDSGMVVWPDGRMQRLMQTTAGGVVDVLYADAGERLPAIVETSSFPLLFTDISGTSGIDFTHRENDFIDYKREPLLPHLYSRMGPALAAGDVNNDGMDDLFAGGPAGQECALFVSAANGAFRRSVQPSFQADRNQEDTGALFFDADNDGDKDLYVVSGGSEKTGYDPYYQDRLYINDGKGIFRKSENTLPVIRSSGGCVSAGDYDRDGDLDLFRGGRISPGNYPFHPQSYLLRNDKGKFTDVTVSVAPDLAYTGMVTSSVWADYNNDGGVDLIVTGEWMPVRIYSFGEGKFNDVTSAAGLGYTNGWWNCITASDIDKDGDLDLFAGNLGINTRIRTSPGKPACVYAGDFDANGSTDAVICCMFSDSMVYPIYSRDEMIDQVRSLRKTIPTYAEYAGKTIDRIFTADQLKEALVEKAYTFLTSWFENKGDGTFIMKPLPPLAQVSQVNAVLAGDYNGDGYGDVLLCGNNFSLTPTQGRLDAGTGLLLAGDGKGSFRPAGVKESGFFANRDAKAMVMLKTPAGRAVAIGNNNDRMQLFRLNR